MLQLTSGVLFFSNVDTLVPTIILWHPQGKVQTQVESHLYQDTPIFPLQIPFHALS